MLALGAACTVWTSDVSPADKTMMVEFVRGLVERAIMRKSWGVLFAFEYETGGSQIWRLYVTLGREPEVVAALLPLEIAWIPAIGT